MFKYLWIVALGVIYVLWTIPSVQEIWSKLRSYDKWYRFSFSDLDESTEAWLFVTIVTPLVASFVVCLCSEF